MKRATLLAVLFTAFHTIHAQPVNNDPVSAIQTDNDTISVQSVMTPQILAEIMTAVGLQQNFELKEAKVMNIEASVSHGKRYIYYNPSFISWITKVTRSKWAAIALLAHEVGHHLNGHTLKRGGSKPGLELEADEFAGFVLCKMGASLEQAQEVMKYIAKPETSPTHPGRASRMMAIQNGWDKAESSMTAAISKNGSSHGATP